ncbi:ORF6N domain-containing protein [Acinetobacter baumannii]|uniref:ORF6N domain-containing protein n=1 Tax=Acinetobacter baumannii TaxID=470 RepID=UPI0027BCC84B|nr:ORF6N domain-containing protein [Acinetobacter baumannii]MDQ2263208.1 ORF6N domain-containing protein [Acinetobacter baumannii]
MVSLTQINNTQVSVINFKSIPVVTTEMLAGFYGTESVRIRQNHNENKQRFIEGKHFFKIVGQELKDFVSSLKLLANSPTISNKVRSLILWTERGAARHAKMLDTDQAWEVFEQLEDCYFVRKEILAKTHKSERTPLHDAHALLVAKTKHLNSSDAWKIINQRFGTNHIDEIPYDMIPVAVEYVHHLIAMYSSAEKYKDTEPNIHTVLRDKDVQFLMWYVPILGKFIKNEIYPALTAIQSSYAGRLSGLTSEAVCHANALNRKAIGYGLTLEHVGNKSPHDIEWYLAH